MSYLMAHDLRKSFRTAHGAVAALDGPTIEVDEGEFVVLLGPSGSGKTTTLRCVAGLETPDDGEITCDGRILFAGRVNVRTERRGMAMVFQSYALWPHMTVAQNISFGMRMTKVKSKDRATRIDDVLERVGLAGFGPRSVNALSGGQMQRVALARALAVHPAVVLMDEPLSNLDPAIRLEMRDEISRLHAEDGRTTLYVTHDQSEALALADRIVVFRDGRIEQSGATEELVRTPASPFVADFMGWRNAIPVRRDGTALMWRLDTAASAYWILPLSELHDRVGRTLSDGDHATLAVHPDGVNVVARGGIGDDSVSEPSDSHRVPGCHTGVVVSLSQLGGREYHGTVSLDAGPTLQFHAFGLPEAVCPGAPVSVSLNPALVAAFPLSAGSAEGSK